MTMEFKRTVFSTPAKRDPKYKGNAFHCVVYIEEVYGGFCEYKDVGRFYYDSEKDRYRADEQMVEFLKLDVLACVLWRYPCDAKSCLQEMAQQIVETWDSTVPYVINQQLIQPS